MNRSEAIKKLGDEFPSGADKAKELERLTSFLEEMKAAGVAKTRKYDLPQPDTIGRILVKTKD